MLLVELERQRHSLKDVRVVVIHLLVGVTQALGVAKLNHASRRRKAGHTQTRRAVQSPNHPTGWEGSERLVLKLHRYCQRVEASMPTHRAHAQIRWVRAAKGGHHVSLLVCHTADSFEVKPVFLKLKR